MIRLVALRVLFLKCGRSARFHIHFESRAKSHPSSTPLSLRLPFIVVSPQTNGQSASKNYEEHLIDRLTARKHRKGSYAHVMAIWRAASSYSFAQKPLGPEHALSDCGICTSIVMRDRPPKRGALR